jgi:hypothetical protein
MPAQRAQDSVQAQGGVSAAPAISPWQDGNVASRAETGMSGKAEQQLGAADCHHLQPLAAQLETELAGVLSAVGVVHLGLDVLGGDKHVLAWRHDLQAVAEPSECPLPC